MAKSLLNDVFENKSLMTIGGGLLAYFIVVKPLLVKVGLQKSSDEIRNDNAATQENAWSPVFWQKAPPGALLLRETDAQNFISDIHSAFNFGFGEDFNAMLNVIKQMKTKSMVSYLSYKYQQKYNADLYSNLQQGTSSTIRMFWEGLSSDQLSTLNNYVSSLPNYTI